jgi:hypothetical protein
MPTRAIVAGRITNGLAVAGLLAAASAGSGLANERICPADAPWPEPGRRPARRSPAGSSPRWHVSRCRFRPGLGTDQGACGGVGGSEVPGRQPAVRGVAAWAGPAGAALQAGPLPVRMASIRRPSRAAGAITVIATGRRSRRREVTCSAGGMATRAVSRAKTAKSGSIPVSSSTSACSIRCRVRCCPAGRLTAFSARPRRPPVPAASCP